MSSFPGRGRCRIGRHIRACRRTGITAATPPAGRSPRPSNPTVTARRRRARTGPDPPTGTGPGPLMPMARRPPTRSGPGRIRSASARPTPSRPGPIRPARARPTRSGPGPIRPRRPGRHVRGQIGSSARPADAFGARPLYRAGPADTLGAKADSYARGRLTRSGSGSLPVRHGSGRSLRGRRSLRGQGRRPVRAGGDRRLRRGDGEAGTARPDTERPATVIGDPATGKAADSRGFLGALFDFGFTSFVTPKVIKVLYMLIVIGTVVSALVFTHHRIQGQHGIRDPDAGLRRSAVHPHRPGDLPRSPGVLHGHLPGGRGHPGPARARRWGTEIDKQRELGL